MELSDCLAHWARTREPSPWTLLRYKQAMRSLAHFGIRSLAHVTREAIAQYVQFRSIWVAPLTVNSDLDALSAVLRFAQVPDEILRGVHDLEIPVKKPRRLSARFLSADESSSLVEGARRACPRVELPILLDLYLGLRVRELCRMRWSEIDLGATPSVRVRIVKELGAEGRIKTGNERSIPVCRALKKILVERRAEFGDDYLFPCQPDALGRHSGLEFVRSHSLRGQLARAVRAARIQRVTWLTLRHTFASRLVQEGVAIAKVASWCGHSVSVCERYYAGLREGYDPDCERMPAA